MDHNPVIGTVGDVSDGSIHFVSNQPIEPWLGVKADVLLHCLGHVTTAGFEVPQEHDVRDAHAPQHLLEDVIELVHLLDCILRGGKKGDKRNLSNVGFAGLKHEHKGFSEEIIVFIWVLELTSYVYYASPVQVDILLLVSRCWSQTCAGHELVTVALIVPV